MRVQGGGVYPHLLPPSPTPNQSLQYLFILRSRLSSRIFHFY